MPAMRDMLLILVHSIVTVVRLIKPGGIRAVVAESALTRHQILILNRSRKRLPACVFPIALSPVYAPFSSTHLACGDAVLS
jgi:hypothetical protein